MSSQHLLCTLCRALFESAEQLEAVSAVRQYENLQREGSQAAAVGLLQTVVYDAGHQCAPQVTFPFLMCVVLLVTTAVLWSGKCGGL